MAFNVEYPELLNEQSTTFVTKLSSVSTTDTLSVVSRCFEKLDELQRITRTNPMLIFSKRNWNYFFFYPQPLLNGIINLALHNFQAFENVT